MIFSVSLLCAVVFCAGFCAKRAATMLDIWFVAALNRDMARAYLLLLPRAVCFFRFNVLSVKRYFQTRRNFLLYAYWTALLCPLTALIACITGYMYIFYGVCAGYLLFSAAPFFLQLLFGRVRGTDGKLYAPFDRFAPLRSAQKRLIRCEKARAEYTRFFGMGLLMDYVTDERDLVKDETADQK